MKRNFIIEFSSYKETESPENLTDELYQTFKKKKSILHKELQKLEDVSILSNLFYEKTTILIT